LFSLKTLLQFSLISMLLHGVCAEAAITVTNISAGELHSLFLESDGSLWAMGRNLEGELGDGTSNFSTNKQKKFYLARSRPLQQEELSVYF
jgi:alpha-tubulin suppressor-like RCC1 family protein